MKLIYIFICVLFLQSCSTLFYTSKKERHHECTVEFIKLDVEAGDAVNACGAIYRM